MSISSEARPPLGLPNGSVRALLTLLIVAVVVVEIIRGHELVALWTETLLIALAHYFSSRRFIHFAPDVIRRLEAEGHIETESNPLYLPRHSVRVLLVCTFIGLAVYLYQSGRILETDTLSLLAVISAYLLGAIARGLLAWWTRGRQTPSIRGWEDLKAIVVLAVLMVVAGFYLADRPDLVPRQLRNAALGMVLFYFGSR